MPKLTYITSNECTQGAESRMQKHIIKFISILVIFAVYHGMKSPCFASQKFSSLIVAGKRIGRMVLGPNGYAILKHFSKPNINDAGMSQTRQVWMGKGDSHATLFIHTTANGAIDAKPENGITIDLIRTSSRSFHTASGISVHSTLAQVKHVFPQVHRSHLKSSSVIYVDRQHGIAFEFTRDVDSARCIAIAVFPPRHPYIVTSADVNRLIRDNVSK